MKLVTGLTDSPAQVFNLVLDDGTIAVMTLSYFANQLAWFYTLSYNGGTTPFVSGLRQIVTAPNLIRCFQNQIPFGLAVTYVGNGEPTGREDWVNGNASLYLLDQIDVTSVEMNVYPGN